VHIDAPELFLDWYLWWCASNIAP